MTAPEPVLVEGRMRTYRGEDRARQACPVPLLDGTQEDAQAYVDRITRSAWWKRECPPSWLGDTVRAGSRLDLTRPPLRIMVSVHQRGSGGVAHYTVRQYRGKWLPRISLGAAPPTSDTYGWTGGARDPYVVLHEVAHVMALGHGERGHGRTFRWCLVRLVRRWLGPDATKALQAGYEAEGLKWRKPR